MNIQEFYDLWDKLKEEEYGDATYHSDDIKGLRDKLACHLMAKGVLQPVPLGISIGDKIEMKGT